MEEKGITKMTDFNDDFEYDLKVGQVKEKLLADILENETIEVKSCTQALFNVFVEYYNLRTNMPSGISVSKAKYYAFVLKNDKIIIITTEELLQIIKRNKYEAVLGCDKNLGYSIPITDIVKIGGING